MSTIALLLVAPALSMSLDDAMQAAAASSPVSAISRARVAEAHAQVRQATAYLLPEVNAAGASLWQNEVILDLSDPFLLFAQQAGIPMQPSAFDDVEWPEITPGQQWQIQVAGQQAILAPSAWLWRKAAQQGEALAEEEGEVDRYQLGGVVVEAWHASARHQALLADARAAPELGEHILQIAETLVANGVATEDQLIPARQALATARATVARAQAASQAADAALALVTARDEPADPFTVPPAPTSLEATLADMDRPDMRMAAQRSEAARAVIWAERGGAMPILGVTGKVFGLDPAPMIADDWNWQVQLGVTVPLVKGGAVAAKVDAAHAQLEMALAAERLVRDQAKLQAIKAHGELSAAMAALTERETALELAGQAVRAAELRLKEGTGTMLELQQGQAGVAEAQVRLTLAKADAAHAHDLLRQVTRGL